MLDALQNALRPRGDLGGPNIVSTLRYLVKTGWFQFAVPRRGEDSAVDSTETPEPSGDTANFVLMIDEINPANISR